MAGNTFQIDTDLIRQFANVHGQSATTAEDTVSSLNAQHEQVIPTLDPQSASALTDSHTAVIKALQDLHTAHLNYKGTLEQIASQADELKAAAQRGFSQIHNQ